MSVRNVLGDIAHVTIGVQDLSVSWSVYNALGFKQVSAGSEPVNWMEITDGSLTILLNESESAYIGIEYFTEEIEEAIRQLESAGLDPVRTVMTEGGTRQVMVASPCGVPITLVDNSAIEVEPTQGRTLLDLTPDQMRDSANYPNAKCGVFGEFSVPVEDMDEAIQAWSRLGFTASERHTSPYEWAILTDGVSVIGLHATEEFTQPTLTYFSPDMDAKLSSLQKEGLEVELFGSKSGKVKTPDGQQIFLFML